MLFKIAYLCESLDFSICICFYQINLLELVSFNTVYNLESCYKDGIYASHCDLYQRPSNKAFSGMNNRGKEFRTVSYKISVVCKDIFIYYI